MISIKFDYQKLLLLDILTIINNDYHKNKTIVHHDYHKTMLIKLQLYRLITILNTDNPKPRF